MRWWSRVTVNGMVMKDCGGGELGAEEMQGRDGE